MDGWLNLSSCGGHGIRAIALGALVLMWPAFWNGYPILYSDTNAFLTQGLSGFFVWDKPFIYGPWMALFHWRYSLWPVLFAQSLVVSSILWLTARSVGQSECLPAIKPSVAWLNSDSEIRYFLVCVLLGLLTAAPWVSSLLMPDIFAPVTVLCIYLLSVRADLSRPVRLWILLVGAFAIASHLSHLVIAAAVLLVVAVLDTRQLKFSVLPLLLALLTLVGTNLYGFQRVAISPFGSVFFLARLAADDHIRPVLEKKCLTEKFYLCEWKNRLPQDSDDFMWDGQGPVWKHPGGPIGLAPEASQLVLAAVLANPAGVAGSLIKNTWRELFMVGLGDTLHPDHLDVTMGQRIKTDFPDSEFKRYQNARQVSDRLVQSAGLFNVLGWVSQIAGLILCVYAGWRAWLKRQRAIVMLIAMVVVGLFANAFATGALSKPHYRYQTRIAWLLVFVPLILPYRIKGTSEVKNC